MDLTDEEKVEALNMDWYDFYGTTSVGMTDDEKFKAYERYFLNDSLILI